jgi:RNA polymerase sigma-70 factor, ECF subfamily
VSLQDVMQRYCAGEQGAFEELYRALAPKIRARVRFLMRESATADDVLQLTFLKLHRARASYVAGADPVPWVQAIARRSCIDEIRRRRTRERLANDPDRMPELTADVTGVAYDAEPEPFADSPHAAVLAALEALPPKQREAVVLTKLEGHSVKKAADLLGTTETAVKLRAHRGYARLRTLLGSDADFVSERRSRSPIARGRA